VSGLTFEKMLLEARSVARSHLNEEIHSTEGNLTVGPDGTNMLGKHYGAISISFSRKTKRDMALVILQPIGNCSGGLLWI
jgi:hypothetical protein